MKQRIWFITGISRGLGKALAEAVLAVGDTVIGTTRTGKVEWGQGEPKLTVMPLELTDALTIRKTVAEAHGLHGRLDVVLNNAGYGLLGAIEEASVEEMEHVLRVNFKAPLAIMTAVLPFLRRQRSGHIVNISSIAGLAPMAGSGLYAAAKFALEGVSEALAQEVRPLGIKITLVEPGAFRTEFLSPDSIRRSKDRIEEYDQTSGKNVDCLTGIAGKQTGDPERGAKAILAAVDAERPPLHLVLGSDALLRTREKLNALSAELDTWQQLSASTDYPTH